MTLVSEFFERGWYGDVLQMYRGHKPGVSAIDWNHYIAFQPDRIQEMFREQVVLRLEDLNPSGLFGQFSALYKVCS